MELGNLMFNFGNKNQHYSCPEFVVTLLRGIERKISLVYWNKNQKEWESAFGNTGNQYFNGTIEVMAYSWNDEEEQPYNFKCGDIEISWYKYLGRDTTINVDPSTEGFNDLMVDMFNKAMQSLEESDIDD